MPDRRAAFSAGERATSTSGVHAGGRGTVLSLKARALRYLSQREHTRRELAQKLGRYTTDADNDLNALLNELEQAGWLSDERAAASLIHRRSSRLGAARLQQELRTKGLAPDLVSRVVGELRDTEVERARAVWQRKFATPPTDAKDRARQMRFLLARGFSSTVAAGIVGGCGEDDAAHAPALE